MSYTKNLILLSIFLSACSAASQLMETKSNDGLIPSSSPFPSSSAATAYQVSSDLQSCSGQVFTVSPVDLDLISSITPLGNLNPPDHTLPTQHIYFHPIRIDDVPARIELRAPGDVVVLNINTTIYHQDGEEIRRDYGLTLGLCEDMIAYFLHIKELTPELLAVVSTSNCWTTEQFEDGSEYEYCIDELTFAMRAGDSIGIVGGSPFGTFDLGLYDNSSNLNYINPSRYSSNALGIVCPLDYFDPQNRELLYEKLEGNIEPPCGKVMHDIPGSLQGNWFNGDVNSFDPSAWDQHLTFAPDNREAALSVISIGGVFMAPGRWDFEANSSSLINTPFDTVLPDGKIYCYETDQTYGRILVQLLSEDALQIEHQNGVCTSPLKFDDPTIYYR